MFGSTSAFWTHVCVLRFCSSFFFFFFFFSRVLEKRGYCSYTVHWTVTTNVDFSAVNSASVYCLCSHKFHFSTIFSLKIGPTVLFTHLKIILLQYFQFSVFNFSKISFIQTDAKSTKYIKYTAPHWATCFITCAAPTKSDCYLRILVQQALLLRSFQPNKKY